MPTYVNKRISYLDDDLIIKHTFRHMAVGKQIELSFSQCLSYTQNRNVPEIYVLFTVWCFHALHWQTIFL